MIIDEVTQVYRISNNRWPQHIHHTKRQLLYWNEYRLTLARWYSSPTGCTAHPAHKKTAQLLWCMRRLTLAQVYSSPSSNLRRMRPTGVSSMERPQNLLRTSASPAKLQCSPSPCAAMTVGWCTTCCQDTAVLSMSYTVKTQLPSENVLHCFR